MRRIPSFALLRSFEAASRFNSFREAAHELCVDHTVVSRNVSRLQRDLGVQLLETSTKGVVLTPIGEEYAKEVRKGLGDLMGATERVRSKGGATSLNISCTPGLATRFLASRISQFTKRYPQFDLSVHPIDAPPDLSTGIVDVDIRQTDDTAKDCKSQVLCNPRIFPVVSPDWLSMHPEVDSVESLLAVPLIHEDRALYWELWLRAAGVEPPEQIGGIRLWHANLAIEAAAAGEGVALANNLLVAKDLEQGRLAEPFSTSVSLMPYLLITKREIWADKKIVLFREWLSKIIHEGMSA